MTVTDIINGLVSDRTLAVTSKKSLEASLDPLKVKTGFLETFLFGDSGYLGVADIMKFLYDELAILTRSTITYPAVFDKESWKAELALAVTSAGDGVDGLYPSGTQTLNTLSPWLTNNGLTTGTAGIIGTDIAVVTSAVTALTVKRKEDTSEPPDGIADTPDYYEGVEETNLESTTAGLLANLISYQTHINAYFDITTAISTNPLFSNVPNMEAAVESSDIADIQGTLVTSINTLTGLVGYFNTYVSSSVTRAAFDLKLTDLTEYLTAVDTGLTDILTARYGIAKGWLSIDNIEVGLRKWLVFWIKQLVGKPKGSYVAEYGANLAVTQAISELLKHRKVLDVFFSGETYRATEYLSTPKCGVYANEGKAIVLLQTLPAFTQFTMYRKELVPTASVDNTQWVDAPDDTVASEVSVFTWEETLPVTPGWYAYRFSIQDVGVDMVDTYSTGSLQSNILGDAYTFTGFTAMTVTSVGHSLSAGDVVLLKTDDTTLITSVESKTADTITLVGIRPVSALVSLGTITKLSGVLYVV